MNPQRVSQDEGPLRCPYCESLLLRGADIYNGIQCRPQLNVKTMAKMALSGAIGAVVGGSAMTWLHKQSWFWDVISAIQF
jgi:hypothetical protein